MPLENEVVAIGIKRIIESKGLLKKAVAKQAGFTTQQFSDMLNGRKTIKADYLVSIANVLGVGINDLFIASQEHT